MTHFNGLTPAEAERLAMLAEECAEVIQVVGKILRHGYGSHHPDTPHISNREMLRAELIDVETLLRVMESWGDVLCVLPCDTERNWQRKLRFTHHQEN